VFWNLYIREKIVLIEKHIIFFIQVFDLRFFTHIFVLQQCLDPNPNFCSYSDPAKTFGFFWIRTHNTGPYSRASIDVKTGSPDPVDFAMTLPLIHWHRNVMAVKCQGPHNCSANCQSHKKWTTDFWQFMQITKCRVLAVSAMVVRPLTYHGRPSAI
jgi:hypothetical protein